MFTENIPWRQQGVWKWAVTEASREKGVRYLNRLYLSCVMPPFEKKLVVVLNEKVEIGKIMNALSHAMLGFGAGVVSKNDVHLNQYIDADGGIHNNISEMPLVILKANSSKIRGLRKMVLDHNVQFVDFTDTMSTGTYEEEFALTKSKRGEELDYWCIVIYGQWDLITEWTKKFSLYK